MRPSETATGSLKTRTETPYLPLGFCDLRLGRSVSYVQTEDLPDIVGIGRAWSEDESVRKARDDLDTKLMEFGCHPEVAR